MAKFIDAHIDRFEVEPICRALSEHGCQVAPSTYYAARSRPLSTRAARDGELLVEIERVFADRRVGRSLAGARKVWHVLRRDESVSNGSAWSHDARWSG